MKNLLFFLLLLFAAFAGCNKEDNIVAPPAETLEIVPLKVGNDVAVLVNEKKSAGTYEVNFNASGLKSGVYFFRMISGNYSDTKKMVLLR